MPNIVIVNKVGILADLYKYCDFAYVGGGFGAGVHSVIEPAIYNAIVTYGPNIQILDEAIEMTERNIGFIVENYLDIILYYDLINEFYKITGVPVIINTSMNVMGEPIVNTPEQAYQMLLKTDMDYLVLGNHLLNR